MSPLEKVPFATFYHRWKYLCGTYFSSGLTYVILKKNNLAIFDCLFGLYVFSHQSCATGTLLSPKDIYPRKSSLNLKQLIFFMFLNAYYGMNYFFSGNR